MVTETAVMSVIRAARPSFRSAHEKAVFAVHSTLMAAGYLLHATGPPAFSDDALSSTPTENEVGNDGWNEFEDTYGFVYTNPDVSPKRVLVKCLAINGKVMVDAVRDGSTDEPLHLEIAVGDYVAEEGGGNGNYAAMFKDFDKLVKAIDEEFVAKLSGSSSKKPRYSIDSETVTKLDGSSRNKASSESTSADRGEEPSPRIFSDPDPYHPVQPPHGYIVPPIPDGGYSDLFPGPGAGAYPRRGDHGGPGGMIIGPNNPMFFGGGTGLPGGFQPGVPPGARFDPYGPPGIPGFEPNRFTRGPRRPGSGNNHPDLEPFRDGSDFI